MNCNGKRMKLETIHLTEAQRCEIIAKLSKPNTPSKRELGWEYEVSEDAIWKVWDNQENILQRMTLMSNDAKTPKWKLDICMMNCDNCLRSFNETLTN